jgi:hypothetical protein
MATEREELLDELWVHVQVVARHRHAYFDAKSAQMMLGFLERGVNAMTVLKIELERSDKNPFANAEVFAFALADYAETVNRTDRNVIRTDFDGRERLVITGSIFTEVKKRMCPLFPFC